MHPTTRSDSLIWISHQYSNELTWTCLYIKRPCWAENGCILHIATKKITANGRTRWPQNNSQWHNFPRIHASVHQRDSILWCLANAELQKQPGSQAGSVDHTWATYGNVIIILRHCQKRKTKHTGNLRGWNVLGCPWKGGRNIDQTKNTKKRRLNIYNFTWSCHMEWLVD